MSTPVERPITKVTLNLYSEDLEWMKERHGFGYTIAIRDILHKHVRHTNKMEYMEGRIRD